MCLLLVLTAASALGSAATTPGPGEAALPPSPPPPPPSLTEAEHDAAVLLRLRASIQATDPGWLVDFKGWGKPFFDARGNGPCLWQGVLCDDSRRVLEVRLRHIKSFPAANASLHMGPGPLLPELAQLQQLKVLRLVRYAAAPWPAIPSEWLVPGAFPRLQDLTLGALSLGAPLPDIAPGVLPALTSLQVEMRRLRTTLPPSWGADPAVLPSLWMLDIQAELEGPLPDWSAGFRRLTKLFVTRQPAGSDATYLWAEDAYPSMPDAIVGEAEAAAASGTPRGGAMGTLPALWSAGFPELRVLALTNLDLSGPIPWMAGSFANLNVMNFVYCGLTGTLPPQLFEDHRNLRYIQLDGNRFTGELPDSWAGSKAIEVLLANNSLAGAAFPPAWLAPGAMPLLRFLDLSGNSLLSGPLPPHLAWPSLETLRLTGSGVEGSVPEAWCQAPFAATLAQMEIENTTVDPTLPPCTSTAWPFYSLYHGADVHPLRSHSGASTLSIAALLALGVLAAAGAAGRFHLRRRVAQRQTQPSQLEDEQASLCGLEIGAGPLAGQQQQMGSAPGLAISRRKRLAAFLDTTVDSGGSPGRSLPMMTPASGPALQQGLSHHLGRSAGQALAGERGGHSKGDRWQSGQRWGLESTGLCIQRNHLQFQLDDEGQFRVLGEGASASVYLAVLNGVPVAAKVCELLPGVGSQLLWREAELQRRSTHPRIVQLLGVAASDGLLILAMELMEGGNLSSRLQRSDARDTLSWSKGGCQVAVDVAEALHFLHTQAHVRHNDVKASNVLLKQDGRACLSDLGVAQAVCSLACTAAGGSFTHAAPEQLLGARCTLAADMYSFGVLLIELTTLSAVTRRGQWRLPRAPDECSQAVLELIEQCLSTDPEGRPTITAALQQLRADAEAG